MKDKRETFNRLLWLGAVNLFISAFTFGGGYTVIPMIRKFFVQKKAFFSEDELLDMAAVAQSTPGAIAVNLSVLAGYRTAGMAGAVISCISAVLPPLVILSAVSLWYEAFRENPVIAAVLRGMEAAVAALIVDLVLDMTKLTLREENRLIPSLAAFSFAASFFLHVDVFLILVFCCLMCLVQIVIRRRREA